MKINDFTKILSRFKKKLKIGLALSSGSARGEAHVGVVKAIVDREIPVDVIAGASAGAIVGAYFAAKGNVEGLEQYIYEATPKRMMDMMSLDLLVGSGGALSHAPKRNQSALMLIDGFLPEGITKLAVDSIFMMPQLGVLSTVHEKAATDVFVKDCLIWLGTCIAPSGVGKAGNRCISVELQRDSGESIRRDISFGDMQLLPLALDEKAKVTIDPARNFDCGEGKGKRVVAEVTGGAVGLVIDCRGRPLSLPAKEDERAQLLQQWIKNLDVY